MAQESNIPKIALLGLAAVLGYKWYQDHERKHLAQGSRNLRMKIAAVHMQDHDIIMDLVVSNPNSDAIQVQSVLGELYAGKNKIADIKMFGDYIAKENSEVTLPLIARPLSAAIFTELGRLWVKGKTGVMFNGSMNINKHVIPITLKYQGA